MAGELPAADALPAHSWALWIAFDEEIVMRNYPLRELRTLTTA